MWVHTPICSAAPSYLTRFGIYSNCFHQVSSASGMHAPLCLSLIRDYLMNLSRRLRYPLCADNQFKFKQPPFKSSLPSTTLAAPNHHYCSISSPSVPYNPLILHLFIILSSCINWRSERNSFLIIYIIDVQYSPD